MDFFLKDYIFISVSECQYVYHMCAVPGKARRVGSHRVGVVGGCELPDVGAGILQEQQTCLNA